MRSSSLRDDASQNAMVLSHGGEVRQRHVW
jgi:hypothetical protein